MPNNNTNTNQQVAQHKATVHDAFHVNLEVSTTPTKPIQPQQLNYNNKHQSSSPFPSPQQQQQQPPTDLSHLQQGSILLADEITSSVSSDYDALVQATIRSAFAHSTILVIAHRLASVVDLDRIIVLRRMNQTLIDQGIGSVQEFEVPWILLNDPESHFYSMCMATGVDNFVLLWCKARDAFFKTQKKEMKLYGNWIKEPIIDYENLPEELIAVLEQERLVAQGGSSHYPGQTNNDTKSNFPNSSFANASH